MKEYGGFMIVGFVNGCFDVLHVGHVRMLKFAKSKCDFLVVGIDSDSRVKELKGNGRPVNNESDRKEMLESLGCVDDVYIFNSAQGLTSLIKLAKPDIMVVGSDYRNKKVVGSEYAKELIFFERIEGYSTSKIVEGSGNR